MLEPMSLFDAIRSGDANAVREMLASDPTLVSSSKEDGTTAVLWCLYTGHAELVPLFERKLDFFEACATGNQARAIELLNQDASLLAGFSGDGHTGLGLSIFFRHPELARELIARGADVNQASRNAMGVAPIHAAASAGDIDTMRLLIQRGADKNAKQASGHTAMDAAKMNGREDMIALLC
jgi:ankyrin repeat protein